MRLVFYGTPELAVPSLERLTDRGMAPLLVVTRRDKPRGRGLTVSPSPVKAAAEARGLPVVTPSRAGAPEELERIRALRPDLIVLAAYGQILPAALLAIPRLGALNVHFSLLPRHRGASPVQAAILAGDEATGVTTMWMTEKLDEGPIFASRPVAIGEADAGTLEHRLSLLGAELLTETLQRIQQGEIVKEAQDSAHATYSPKLTREDARLRLEEDPESFTRRVRAFAPRPGAHLPLESGESLLVLAAAPGEAAAEASPAGTLLELDRERGIRMALGRGSVWLRRVRAAGRKEMGGFDYANGARLRRGARLPVKGAA